MDIPTPTRSSGTSVAVEIVVDPGVEFKAIESDALRSYSHLGDKRPYFGIEAIAIHAEVARCIPEAE